MQTRQLLIFIALILLAAGVVIGAVTAYQRSHNAVLVETPAGNKPADKTTVDAPNVHIENDKDHTKIEAPGVKIEVPKSPSDK